MVALTDGCLESGCIDNAFEERFQNQYCELLGTLTSLPQQTTLIN